MIEIPDKEKYEFIRKNVYGGRVTSNKLEFTNNQYQQELNNVLKDLNLSREDYIKTSDQEKNEIDREISKNMNY